MSIGADLLEQGGLDQLEFHRLLEHIASFAVSSLGVELLSELMPHEDPELARRENRMVGEMVAMLSRDEDIPLTGVHDVREALSVSRIAGSVLSAENLLHVQSSISAIRRLRDFFVRHQQETPLLHELVQALHTNRLLEKHITDAIDETGNVRDNASRDLARIRRDIIDRSAALRERLQKILRRVAEEELVTDEYVTLREGRLVLPVRAESKRRIPGIIHGESQSGATVFLEPAEIFDMNNEIAELTFAERREVERILRTLTEEVGTEAQLFQVGMQALQVIDGLHARGRYARRYDCVEPEIVDEPLIRLEEAYHPLLRMRLDHVVPMSIELDETIRCMVISGPNAGGKTVAMKTVGLLTAMALSGIHPPAARCVVHAGRVFTDIGDQQSLENDLSTFSSHMSRIAEIVREARAGDVVLLDEIGTGTDPDEGGAIAAAIIEHLLRAGCHILATTHHSFLKVFAFETEGVENAGMEFDTATITPTYRFIAGMPGSSYAFELLQRLGFRPELLAAAREKMGADRNRMGEIISQLEETLLEGRQMRDEQQRLRREAEELRSRFEEQSRTLADQKREIIQQAREEARQTVSGANSLIENALREIREGADKDRVKELRRSIEDLRDRFTAETRQEKNEEAGLRKGDVVRMKGGAQIGEIAIDPDDKGNVIVQFGAMRMRASVDELEPVSRKELRQEKVAAGRAGITNVGEAETRIDLRGMYPDEAEVRLEQAIAAAISANLSTLDVIHGKGTGVLRKRVHEILSRHPAVAEHRLGALTEGGAGVTIVQLK